MVITGFVECGTSLLLLAYWLNWNVLTFH